MPEFCDAEGNASVVNALRAQAGEESRVSTVQRAVTDKRRQQRLKRKAAHDALVG